MFGSRIEATTMQVVVVSVHIVPGYAEERNSIAAASISSSWLMVLINWVARNAEPPALPRLGLETQSLFDDVNTRMKLWLASSIL